MRFTLSSRPSWLPACALLCLLLSGCMPSRQEIREAQRDVLARQDQQVDCRREDRCALTSPLYRQAQALEDAQPPRHHLRLLEWGQDALIARIHLIRSAQRSILSIRATSHATQLRWTYSASCRTDTGVTSIPKTRCAFTRCVCTRSG